MELTHDLAVQLPKFFGLHRVKPHKGFQVRFVVMGNVFATHKKIHQRYDLKGSTLGRMVTDAELAIHQKNVTYKDVDWRNSQRHLNISEDLRENFIGISQSLTRLLWLSVSHLSFFFFLVPSR
jgi:polyphosphate kinase